MFALQSAVLGVLLAAMNFKTFTCAALLLATVGSALGQGTEAVTNVWQFRLPDRGTQSSPALALDGTIYQGTFHGWLVAISPEGKLKWKFKAGHEIRSSPAVGPDGTIYFGSRDRKFYALTPAGSLKWTFATGAWVDSSPAIAPDGTVYFGSWDTNFYALTPDGSLKWQFPTGDIIFSSPAIGADGTVYFGSHDKNLYALNPDGKMKWKFATGAQVTASPAIGGDGTVYFSSTDGNLYALNPDGTKRWQLHVDCFTGSSPVLDEAGNLYLGVSKERISVSPDSKVRWRMGGNEPISISSAAMRNGLLFTTGFASISGLIRDDAYFLWNFRVGYAFTSSPNISPDGVIYQADEMFLYALKPATNAAPPARSSWPLWRSDPQHTGRVQK